MSWSIHTPEAVSAEDAAALTPDLSNYQLLEGAQKPTKDQIKAAQKAVAELVKAVGGKKDTYFVSISGHANPGHEPMPGYANEIISVSVSARPFVALPEPHPDDTE